MTKLVFLDTETTGLNPEIHDVWEIAVITATGDEHTWTVTPDLSGADPQALAINRYYQRTAHLSHPGETVLHPTTGDRLPTFHRPARAALQLACLLDGATVIGSNPAFDQAFLTRWLRRNGQCWTAHYRTIDVITLAWGHLTATTRTPLAWPPSTTEVCAAAGIDLTAYDRHTALGDARWVRDLHTTLTKEAQ